MFKSIAEGSSNHTVRRGSEPSEWTPPVFVITFVVAVFTLAMLSYRTSYMNERFLGQQNALNEVRQQAESIWENRIAVTRLASDETAVAEPEYVDPESIKASMLYDMEDLYELNSDTIGWLMIDDTVIDYPVMQTPMDEEYYLDRDFQKNYSPYGSLIMDTEFEYQNGTKPSTNLIIHGHNMKNGTMFGGLDKYRDAAYEREHSIIKFKSLYEEREYEIVSVFLSQVFLKTQTNVFKYYQFFEADSKREFNKFYKNIKDMALYDTGVTAEYGDEFITLSVCAYHVENGRLVVVAKRIK